MNILVKELDNLSELDLWFQIKFRKKGEVMYLNIPKPKGIEVPQGYRGIDLTCYPVIHLARRSWQAAEQLCQQTGAVLVYQWECVGENADGIVLPDGFNSQSVAFYVTDLQKKEAVLLDLYQESRAIPESEQVDFLISRYPDLLDKIRISEHNGIIVLSQNGWWIVQLSYREVISSLIKYWPALLLGEKEGNNGQSLAGDRA